MLIDARTTPNPHHHDTRRGLAATARRITIELAPHTIEQIATRVTQLLQHDQRPAPKASTLLTVKELAHHLQLNPSWVYEHADQLGAKRTGNGPKARIRFDPHTATQALKQHQREIPPAPAARTHRAPQRPTPYPTDAPLLQARDPYTRGIRGCLPRTRRHARLGVG
jgi:hypothetical protein